MGISKDTVVRASRRQVSARLGDEDVILGLTSGGYFGLDGVGSFVWERLSEPRRVADLQSAVLEEYEVNPDRCFEDLCSLLGSLEEQGLIERVDAL